MALIAAFEDADNIGAEVDAEAGMDAAAQSAADVAAVTDMADEAAVINDDVQAAGQDTAELEAIGEVAEAAVESGEGLSEQAAEVATIAIEGIHQRLGFRGKQRIIAATESFGNRNTRLHSTKLIIEGIGDVLKKVWTAIKEMAKKIWDKITMIFNKITGSGKALRDHLEALKKRAKDISPNAEMKDKELDNKSLAKKLSINKTAGEKTYMDLCTNAEALREAAATMVKESAEVAKKVRDALEKVTGPKIDSGVIDDVKNAMIGTLPVSRVKNIAAGLGQFTHYTNKDNKPGEKETLAYGSFVGNCVFFITVETGKVSDGAPAGTVPATRTAFHFGSAGDDLAATKAEALSSVKIVGICDAAIKIAAKIEDLQKIQKEGTDTSKNIMAACEKMLNSVGKMAEDSASDQRHAFATAKDKIQEAFGVMNSMGAQAPALYLQTAQLGAEYAGACISNFKS